MDNLYYTLARVASGCHLMLLRSGGSLRAASDWDSGHLWIGSAANPKRITQPLFRFRDEPTRFVDLIHFPSRLEAKRRTSVAL